MAETYPAVHECGATWLWRHDQPPLTCTRSTGHEGPHQEARPVTAQPSRPDLRPVVPPPPPHIPVGGSEHIDSRGLTWDITTPPAPESATDPSACVEGEA